MKIILKASLTALAFASLSASPALAITDQAWEFATLGSNGTNNAWNFGARFEARNYTFSYFGCYDDNGDGFAGSQTHDVTLYDIAGNLISSATVSNADPLVGHWRWAKVARQTINGTYQIHGTSGSDNYAWNTNGFGTNAAINYLGNTWALGTTPVFLDFHQDDTGDGYWGANLTNMVPESASWAMLIAGFGLTGAAMRRRPSVTSVAA